LPENRAGEVNGLEQLYDELKEKIIDGDQGAAKLIVQKLLDGGAAARQIIDTALIPSMDIVGDRFQKQEFFIPELLVASRAMEGCLAMLQPLLAASDVQTAGVVIIGTVKGDLHDIGKNIVAAMLKGAGFKIIDLGIDVDAQKFVSAIKDNKPDLVGLSALLTTTMRSMKETIAAIDSSGFRGSVKIIVGGAPLTQDYANQIGADGFAPDAAQAVKIAKQLIA
jgi:5-methyltetrahydrofolate--homocysteine methyltransferase